MVHNRALGRVQPRNGALAKRRLDSIRQVHLVDFFHAPPILQKRIVGGIDEVMQRQAGVVVTAASIAFAAFVGNSSRISVV